MHTTRALIAAGAAVALALALPATASASAPPASPTPQVWSSALGAPFSLAVDGQQRVLVADGVTGTISRLQPDGTLQTVVDGIPGLTGIATRGAWLAYSSSEQEPGGEEAPITASGLNIRTPQGSTVYADLHAYEWAHNSDARNTYGVTDPASCIAGVPEAAAHPGGLDAHAYNVTSWNGAWLVADAGANAIMKVTDSGQVSTFAVLPAIPVAISGTIAGMLGMPDCAIGTTLYIEPVPTGIAVGTDGAVYVTTLPGFPGMIVSQGALWRIDPATGVAAQVASGLSEPTSLAISGSSMYIAELGGAGVSVVRGGQVSPFAALPGALAVATSPNGTVWSATMGSDAGPGTLVSISNHKVRVQAHLNR
jgi:hypothetical protein